MAGAARSETGVRHQVTVLVLPMAGTPARRADLRVVVRISDHAADARFYGSVEAAFAELDPRAGAAERVVWEDAGCHRERGLPKINVLKLAGTIATEQGPAPFEAVVRRLGKHVPADELVERKHLGAAAPPVVMAIDAAARASGFAVRVSLLARACALPGP